MTEQTQNIHKGIGLSILAFFFFSVSDTARKYLSLEHDLYDIFFWQAIVGIGVLMVFSPWMGGVRGLYNAKRVRWHLLRGVLMMANTILSLNALSRVPIMDAYTIYFTTPFVVCLLSFFLFKEPIGRLRLLIIAMGFVGGLVAFRPGFAALDPAYLFACAAVFTFSFSSLIAKHTKGGRDALAYGLYPLVLLLFLCVGVKGGDMLFAPNFEFLAISVVSGAAYALALVAASLCFQMADTAVVAPYQYTQLIWALGFGYLIFGDVPDTFKVIGAGIIVGSGIVFFMRERTRKSL
ncbi:MAG: DMT family transporter [Alphaproteobacteria bacterium]